MTRDQAITKLISAINAKPGLSAEQKNGREVIVMLNVPGRQYVTVTVSMVKEERIA